MKKLIYCAAALATALFAGSCQQELLDNAAGETTVSYSVALPGASTKAIGDGTNVNQLVYEVWKVGEDGNITDLSTRLYQKTINVAPTAEKKWIVSLNLVQNQYYKVLFWAQVQKEAGFENYDTDELRNVHYAFDVTKAYSSNQEDYAAFYGTKNLSTFSTPQGETITLTRPFGQLNIGTTNNADETEYTVALSQSSVEVTVPTSFNVATSETSGETKVNFNLANVPTEVLPVSGTNYEYVAMNYVFAGSNSDVTYTIDTFMTPAGSTESTPATITKTIPNVPFKENYRTNIIGDLLRTSVAYEVVVDADFNDKDDAFEGGKYEIIDGYMTAKIETVEDLDKAIANPETDKVVLFEDIKVVNGYNVTNNIVVDLNGKALSYTGDDVLFRVKNGATMTIDGTVEGSAIVTNPTTPGTGGNGYVGLVSEGATLNINGGSYDAQGTCTIAQVVKGALNIYGGTFKVSLNKYTDANGEASYLLNCSDTPYKNGEAVINVYGGTFYKFNPENNAAEGVGTNFCAEYHSTKKDGDYYTVVAPTVNEYVVPSEITLDGNTVIIKNAAADYGVVVSGNGTVCFENVEITATTGNGITISDGSKVTLTGNNLTVVANDGSAISGDVTIDGLNGLRAEANCPRDTDSSDGHKGDNGVTGSHWYGIGGAEAKVTIKNSVIDYAKGAHVQPDFKYDTNYGKTEPEGSPAIGGKEILILNSTIIKADGGSKSAAIGAEYWASTNITIKKSTILEANGGNASAGIGGSRYSSDIAADKKQSCVICIENSTVTATGGQYGAGIGSGYDTHCKANSNNAVNDITIINSKINAQGGKYAAGIGTGFHAAALTGSIDAASRINAVSGENFYKSKYTTAQNIGYGVVDPAREYKDQIVTFTVASETVAAPSLYNDQVNVTNDGYTYNVHTAAGLKYINDLFINGEDGTAVVINLTEDIDFTGYTWTTVDSHVDAGYYMSAIDGKGHTISNLTINGQAMFRRFAGLGDVIIKDITFDNANVNSNGNINTSILTVQTYQNVLLDNVDVNNSTIIGGYKVAPLIGTVYNESSSTITATLKNCDVTNTTVKATSYDFCTTGMVAFVHDGNNDKIEFKNCTVSNVKLYAPNVYTAHAAIYTTGSETLYNEAEGVTVSSVTFENI